MINVGLLSPYNLGNIALKNRIVMAPVMRSRAISNTPNELMAQFYGQRAGAGLIITEGTSPSPNGLGYSRIPGIFTDVQIEGWKKVTKAVHSKDGKIFVQLMHTGRISHPANMCESAIIFAPSAIRPIGQMWTDALGLRDYPTPRAMALDEIHLTKQEYISAAVNAINANFDGIEIDSANGYLPEQFLSPASNVRNDQYGGCVENRCRFLLEVIEGVIKAIGKERIGVSFSPYGIARDMPHYPEIENTYNHLSLELNRMGIQYIYIVDQSSMGAPEVPVEIKRDIRKRFEGTIILSGGYTKRRAANELQCELGNLIAFGRPFISNPDLVERYSKGWPSSIDIDLQTYNSPGEKGYTDYPLYTK